MIDMENKVKVKKRRKNYRLIDYIICAMMAALGLAIKPIIVPLAHILTGPLMIPGGVVAGGFYMLFLVLGEAITKKRGSATVIALIQAVLVTVTGSFGSQGAASLLIYALPGLAVDLMLFITRKKCVSAPVCFAAGLIANVVGSYAVNFAIFNLSFVPLMLSLCAAALSGGIGGLVAHGLATQINKLEILNEQE